jgi:hypothetical protein
MLYRETIADCSETHTEHINALCGQSLEFFNLESDATWSNHGLFNDGRGNYICSFPHSHGMKDRWHCCLLRHRISVTTTELSMFRENSAILFVHLCDRGNVYWINMSRKVVELLLQKSRLRITLSRLREFNEVHRECTVQYWKVGPVETLE